MNRQRVIICLTVPVSVQPDKVDQLPKGKENSEGFLVRNNENSISVHKLPTINKLFKDERHLCKRKTFTSKISQSQVCWHCTLEFQKKYIVWNLPIAMQEKQIKSVGFFCSFPCMLAYANEYEKRCTGLVFAFFADVLKEYRKLYHIPQPFMAEILRPAPSRLMLTKFGGPLSEEMYREIVYSGTLGKYEVIETLLYRLPQILQIENQCCITLKAIFTPP